MDNGFKSRGRTMFLARTPYRSQQFPITVPSGQLLQTLEALIHCGATGCSFFDNPAPRWSSYIHRLRTRGFDIQTVRENHEGQFPRYHARYFLLSEVTRVAGEAAK
jgi:hypothetical protein